MRMRGGGGGDIHVTQAPCSFIAGNVPLFVGAGINFLDNTFGAKAPRGNCQACAAGAQNYYAPAVTPVLHQTIPLEAIGTLNLANCPNLCVCNAANVCYTRATDDTVLTFWPYCSGSAGLIPVGGGTGFPYGNLIDPITLDAKPVIDPSYPQISRVGCNGCPAPSC
uniref:Uncharacterized protein n=1 Tax=Panagrolaimus davidi TaxID=227884 RepID=A0A914PZR0_9BILA